MINNNENFMKLYSLLAGKCIELHKIGLPVVVCGSYYMFYDRIKGIVVCSCNRNEHVMDIDPNEQTDEAFWKLCLLASFFIKPYELQ